MCVVRNGTWKNREIYSFPVLLFSTRSIRMLVCVCACVSVFAHLIFACLIRRGWTKQISSHNTSITVLLRLHVIYVEVVILPLKIPIWLYMSFGTKPNLLYRHKCTFELISFCAKKAVLSSKSCKYAIKVQQNYFECYQDVSFLNNISRSKWVGL